MANDFSQAARMKKSARLRAKGKRLTLSGAACRRWTWSRKGQSRIAERIRSRASRSPASRILFNDARNKVALRFRPWPLGCDRKCGQGREGVRQFIVVVKPFEMLRLKHDKVRNEFEVHCLVQHQVPRL